MRVLAIDNLPWMIHPELVIRHTVSVAMDKKRNGMRRASRNTGKVHKVAAEHAIKTKRASAANLPEAVVKSCNQGRIKRAEFYAVVVFVLLVCVSILFVSVTVAFAVRRSVVNASAETRSASAPNAAEQNTSATNPASQSGASQATSPQGSSQAPSAPEPSSAKELSTVSGMVTDSYCGARHSRNSNRSSTECVRYCMHRGASYILVSSGGSYTLRGNKTMFNKFAGQRAKVTGDVDGHVIGVRSIVASE